MSSMKLARHYGVIPISEHCVAALYEFIRKNRPSEVR